MKRVDAALCLCWFIVCGLGLPAGGAELPRCDAPAAVTTQQIEADWLRQEVVRETPATTPGGKITPEEDAIGACDGVIDGKWGFHTLNEDNPWWQIDLGKPTALGRIVLYNRTDLAQRNARIIVLCSNDAKDFRQVYQHDGKVFYGHADKKPLVVDLRETKTRYLRLQLPGRSYFHLDEVEIYAADGKQNIGPGKPATQSSTSQWSARHTPVVDSPKAYATGRVIERGLKLADSLNQLGTDVAAEAAVLRQTADRLDKLAQDAPERAQRQLYMRARWAVRKMALKNPLLDFDDVLFVKRVPPAFPHMSDQYYGWWSRPGGGIYVLRNIKSDAPRLECLTEGWPEGSFLRPDLSYDGKKVLFAHCKFYPQIHKMVKMDKEKLPEDAFYKIYEMNVDGSGVRRLTHGKYDDFDCRYLPNDEIVFLSTRKGPAIQCNRISAAATVGADLPDSYVRCGGGDTRPVPVFTLHCIDADGNNIHPISAFENFEWTPSVAADGRILYARWDYIDRFNGRFMSLWSTNPDGTNPQLVYGNFTSKPQCVFEARSIPNSTKLVFTAAAHHSNMGGSLVLLDRTRGTEFERPLTRLTPEVCFPETEGWPKHYYANPYPLSEEYYLVAWSDQGLPPHTFVTDERNPANPLGVYLYDAFGNLELLHRDGDIASMYPLPLRPRRRPPTFPNTVDWAGPQEGRFMVQDVYQGLQEIERGEVRRLRVIGVPPKVQPYMNSPVLGVSREDPGKFVLGTVPVEEDGSAWFRVPSGIPVFFQALDRKGLALQTMRTLTYVQPNQTLGCIGCHEHRDAAPAPGGMPLAATREPSRLTPGPSGSWPLRYDELVQPLLDRLCVRCHSAGSTEIRAAAMDLTPARSYDNLLQYGEKDLHNLVFERDQSLIGDMPARKSKLWALLTDEKGHEGARLDADGRDRLTTWMDTYAQRLGHFSDEQEEQLRQFRRKVAAMLTE